MCRPVLEFDTAAVSHAARTRRGLESLLLGSTGFRGRSLAASGGAPALRQEPLPRPEPLRIVEEEEEEVGAGTAAGPGAGDLLPTGGAADGPVLVSVLLPANASGAGAGGSRKLSAVDKVFVVLLHPREKYVTYECGLPRPVVL